MKRMPDTVPDGPLAHGPLTGVRVLDFTWVLAGPYCTRILADLGAEVIKVQSRSTAATEEHNESGYFVTWNRNKRGVTLNMATAKGIRTARTLAAKCDVVIDNFSGRVMRNWGLDYESLRAQREDIIVVSMSGTGQFGPWRDLVSFGPTLQALSGYTLLMSEPERPPIGFGFSYADHAAGSAAALAVVAALRQRDTTGDGQFIDISQFETLTALLGPALLDASVNGVFAAPAGNRPQYGEAAPRGVYPCAGDDRWIAISVSNADQWDGLCRAVGEPDMATRFATLKRRLEAADEIDERIAAWTRERQAGHAIRILQSHGVPAGALQQADDLVDRDPYLAERGFFVSAQHPALGETRFDGFPVIFSETSPTLRRSAPVLGQDNAAVFGELLGLPADEIQRLEAERVIW